ncbi:MAG: hypothetical protein O2780_14880 [Proteobacteria bacterium]|nr:hypothetical protein [Pseudomonadota bacterium]MDA1302043.1 hypothetical protein [Pseudomonadota bacterium]
MSDIRMRQICLVAHDLARIQHQLESVFNIEVAYRDPGVGAHGLHNMLMPVGNQLLETVSPLPDQPDTAGGRYLQRRGGDGGYMVIMQVPRAAYRGHRQRIEGLGIRLVAEPGEGLPDTGGIQLHPKDVPGAIPELRWNDGEAQPDGPWWPAGPDWRQARNTSIIDAISAAEIQTSEPATLAARWGEVLDEPVTSDAHGHPAIALADAQIRFVPITDGRPTGLGGLDLHTTDLDQALTNAEANGCLFDDRLVMICGMRLRLH